MTSEEWDGLFSRIENMPAEALPEIKESQIIIKTHNELKIVRNNLDQCEKCNGKIISHDDLLICSGCGLECGSDNTEDRIILNGYNRFMPFRIISSTGALYEKYQKELYNIFSAAKTTQDPNLLIQKSLKTINEAHKPQDQLSQEILFDVAEMLLQIREHCGFKGLRHRGIIAAVIYYVLYAKGKSKTPQEISDYCGIKNKQYVVAEKLLRELNWRGIIKLPEITDPIKDYLDRYLTLLNIPVSYKDFLMALIQKGIDSNINIKHDCTKHTKCVGAIYILTTRIPELKITEDQISQICKISKPTFRQYADVISTYYKKFRPIFKKFRIPMPNSWRKGEEAQIRKKRSRRTKAEMKLFRANNDKEKKSMK